MPTRDEIAFFGAGPARIPTGIAEAGGRDFVNYLNSGVSLAEISHRSPTATKVLTDAKSALTKLLEVPDNYEILVRMFWTLYSSKILQCDTQTYFGSKEGGSAYS